MRRVLSLVPIGFALLVLGASSRAHAADTLPPVITHVPVTTAQPGSTVTIAARIQDESQIFGATLWYRPVGAPTYTSIDLTHKGDMWVASIPVTGNTQYWLEAYDEFGNGPARAGSPDQPFVIKIGVAGAAPTAPARVATAAPPRTAAPTTSAAPKETGSTQSDSDDNWAEQDQFPTEKQAAPTTGPLAPTVEKGPPVPYYQQWWFGTTIGVVGAGVIATVVYLLIPKPVYQNVFDATLRPGS